jgi:hypothetical protein
MITDTQLELLKQKQDLAKTQKEFDKASNDLKRALEQARKERQTNVK